MNILKRDVKIERKFIMMFIIINFLIIGIYYSYGIFIVKQLKDDISLISVSSNIITMSSSDLTDNSITVAANSTKDITITVTNSAITERLYRILHAGVPTGVAVYEKNGDSSSEYYLDGSGTVDSVITIDNTTDEAVTVTFKCQDGVEYYDKEMNYSYVNHTMNFDHSGALSPKLDSVSMIPVYYEATSETDGVWKKADANNTDADNIWYDYDNFQWANVVTVNSTNRDTYLNASAGTEIPMSEINAFFVWIPSFKYYIVSGDGNTSLERQINVLFRNSEHFFSASTVTCSESISNLSNSHLYSEICNDQVYGSIYNNLSTYYHPSFGDYDAGFWVGKFASSNSNTAYIKPNVSLETPNDLLSENGILGIERSDDNIYGLRDAYPSIINSMEWGAIAILANSPYGKSGNQMYSTNTLKSFTRVYDNKSNYYTGRSTNYTTSSTSIVNSSTTTVNYNDLTDVSHTANGITYPIGYKGAGASTTGTVYGVYDMAGGQYKTVMGVFMNEDETEPINEISNYYDFTPYSYVPYQGDVVDNNTASYLEVFRLGDGVKEHVRSYNPNGMWQDGNVTLANSGIMRRGGYYNKNGSLFTTEITSNTEVYATYVVMNIRSGEI